MKEENKNKKEFKLAGFTIWRICAYFIIYSFIGHIIETVFMIITTGVWECKQSLVYGPFCFIYGIGAITMILCLQSFKGRTITVFSGGFFVGSVMEYSLSWIEEAILKVRWWDYSNYPFNINGRICLAFSFFWGLLAIMLIMNINPFIDKIINFCIKKFKRNILKTVTVTFFILLVIDIFFTIFSINMFFTRISNEHGIEIKGQEGYMDICNKLYENKFISLVTNKFFSDQKMVMTFPELKVTKKNGETDFVRDILSDVKSYYLKIDLTKKMQLEKNNLR